MRAARPFGFFVPGDVPYGKRAGLVFVSAANSVRASLIALENLRALQQIVRRIAADRKLRRQKQTGPLSWQCPFVSFPDLFHVRREGADYGIDLRECDLHPDQKRFWSSDLSKK